MYTIEERKYMQKNSKVGIVNEIYPHDLILFNSHLK